MSDIPSELHSIILLHVPAERLIRLRCVCKTWCRLIDDPHFIESHTVNWINKDTSNIHLLLLKYSYPPRLLSLNSFNYVDEVNSMQFNPHRIPITLWSHSSNFFTCNGLILVQKYLGSSSWSIINPLTQEFYELPWLDENDGRNLRSKNIAIGFGYDCATNDYKIVTSNDCFGNQNFGTFIYSLKSNSWKKIKIDDSISISIKNRRVLYNGALHWIGKSKNMMVAFELESEEIRFYPIPMVRELCEYTLELQELGGRLSLSQYIKSEIRIWLMDKYGDEDSWSLLYKNSMNFREGCLRPISLSASKEYLLLHINSSSFLFVNLKHNTTKILNFPKGHPEVHHSEICMFRPSLARITNKQITTGNITQRDQITTANVEMTLRDQITAGNVEMKERKLKKKCKCVLNSYLCLSLLGSCF